MRSLRRVGVSAALLALGACSRPPEPPAARLWTLFDVEALYVAGAGGTTAIAEDDGLPGGIPLELITSGPTPGATLAPRPAWAGGQKVWFLTTEVWTNYPRVWTQPAYLPATRASDGSLQLLTGSGAPPEPIFSVGPGSGFYSPFWQLVYAEVPPGTAPDALTSVRQILDGGYPLTQGPGRMMPLTPAGLGLPSVHAGDVGPPGTGFLDGAPVQYFDFGGSMFSWDPATNVVAPGSIYVLTFAGDDRQVHATPLIPTVLGPAPAGAGVALPDGGQRNVAYYQVVTVVVPAGARVFAPPQDPDLIDGVNGLPGLVAAGIDPGTYSAAIMGADPSALSPYYGRVAVNPTCFDDPTDLPHDPNNANSCIWLDSEAALAAEADLSLAQPTGITVTWEVTTTVANGTETPVPLVTE